MPPLRRRGRGGSGGRGAGATQQPRQQRTPNQQKTRQKRHFVTFFVGGAAPPLPPSSTPAAPQQHPSSTLTTPPRPNPDHTPTPHLYSADATAGSRRKGRGDGGCAEQPRERSEQAPRGGERYGVPPQASAASAAITTRAEVVA